MAMIDICQVLDVISPDRSSRRELADGCEQTIFRGEWYLNNIPYNLHD